MRPAGPLADSVRGGGRAIRASNAKPMRPETTRPRRETARRAATASLTALRLAVSCCAAVCVAAGPNVDAPITATWAGVGLHAWVGRVGADMATPIVVDRRLAPDTPITLECQSEPLGDVVGRAAQQAGGELVVLASSLRIVPAGMGDLLLRAERARDARLARLPAGQRAVAATRRPWHWPTGAVPAELVAAVAKEAGVLLDGIDALPHDHLPAAALPPLSLAERLDLLLAHYDRRVEWRSGGSGKPAGRIIALEADLPPRDTSTGEKRPAPKPAARTPPPAAAPGGRETFSLRVAAPLEQVLGAIAMRTGLTLELDRESLRQRGIAPGEIVRATVENASRKQLLDAVLDPLELDWTITGGTLRVFAAPQPR